MEHWRTTRRAWLPAFFFALLLAQVHGQETAAGNLSFCAYNVRNWLKMERFEKGRRKEAAGKPEEEKRRVIQTLLDIRPDVLGLCEVGDDQDVAEIQGLLKAGGLDLGYLESCHGGDATRRLVLLSRFPIVARSSQRELSYRIGVTTLPMQRGILDATVEVRVGFRIRFLGVHLKSMREVPEADQSLMRKHEARLLREYLDSILAVDLKANLLCYGDFNEHRNGPAIATIMGGRSSPGFMAELQLADAHGQVWTHFWDAADTYSRLDYVFCSRSLRTFIDMKRSGIHLDPVFEKASDHRPIVIRIREPK
jgi:endonuclease/exonuclease/phosphatase family metal-dependent hydrolase